MIRMPAFGLNGPYKNYRCLGLHVDGVSGHSYNKGYVDEEPSRRGETVAADAAAGASAAFASFTALWNRRKTGKGQLIELPLAENFIPFMSESITDFNMNKRVRSTIGNRDRRMAPHGVYPCIGEDKWMTIAVSNNSQWQSLCTIIGLPDLATDIRFKNPNSRLKNQDELDEIVSQWTKTQNHFRTARVFG